MSESLDKVHGVDELPIFPLAVVLFPGVPLPLHIFEPRYRQMLEDVRAGNNLFGISYFDAEKSQLDFPAAGHVGCVAEVGEVQSVPDGRSNVLGIGVIRYKLESYIDTDVPYLMGRISFFEDTEDDDDVLGRRAEEVASIFMRIARAVRVINDERANLPDLPNTEPERLSFLVAAAVEMEADVKQELLELRSTSERLRRLRDLLAKAVAGYEERAKMHTLARGNGHAGKKVNLE